MLFGYARVSTGQQNLDRQVAALKRAGCRQIFKEKQSGREGLRRLQLEKAIEALGASDILVLAEWDRATLASASSNGWGHAAPCSRRWIANGSTSPRR